MIMELPGLCAWHSFIIYFYQTLKSRSMKTKQLLFIAAMFALPFFYSCKKEIRTSPVQIYLTDNPIDYDSVIIHIKGIEVNVLHDTSAWISINTKDTIV